MSLSFRIQKPPCVGRNVVKRPRLAQPAEAASSSSKQPVRAVFFGGPLEISAVDPREGNINQEAEKIEA